MTVETAKGNAFGGTGDAVVVTVNCIGAMGRGIALECRSRIPWLYRNYRQNCSRRKIQPGRITLPWCLYDGPQIKEASGHNNVVLLPTKDDWKQPSQIRWIDNGLQELVALAELKGWRQVDMTLPGGANGWLKNKRRIWELMDQHLGPSTVEFVVWGL